MKKEIFTFTAFFIYVILAFALNSAHAASSAQSRASIDWTSLIIVGDIEWHDQWSESHTDVETDIDWMANVMGQPGWVFTDADAFVENAHSVGWTSDESIAGQVDICYADGIENMWTHGEGGAWRQGAFEALIDGLVTISADYELWQELSTDNEYERASGSTYVSLSLTGSVDSAGIYNEVSDGDYMLDSDFGTLTASAWFNAGEYGFFDAQVNSQTEAEVEVIPEPATVSLLGLVGLLVRRRKH